MPTTAPASNRPFILFITGISVAGKTTAYEDLKLEASIPGCDFHDIDEEGVPDFGRGSWRAFRVEELFGQAVNQFREGRSTIICGIVKPHEVVESVLFDPSLNVHFLLLEISFETFRTRILARLKDAEHAHEVWDEVRLATLFEENRTMIRILRHSVASQVRGHVMQVDSMPRDDMLAGVRQIVAETSR